MEIKVMKLVLKAQFSIILSTPTPLVVMVGCHLDLPKEFSFLNSTFSK